MRRLPGPEKAADGRIPRTTFDLSGPSSDETARRVAILLLAPGRGQASFPGSVPTGAGGVQRLSTDEIKRIREQAHVSQPVFARYLNTSESTVQKWEAGTKRPSGMALKLLAVVEKHGLKVLA